MSQYITLGQLKESLGITDAVDDGRLQTVTFQASALIDEYLRSIRPGYVGFAGSSNTHGSVGSNTRTYDGSGDATLFIDDAASIASVAVDGTTITSTSWIAWPYNEIAKRAIIYKTPTIVHPAVTQGSFGTGIGTVTVDAYWGLPFIPQDVYEVALALATLLWRRQQKGDYTGSSMALNSQRFQGGAGRQFQYVIDPEIAACLSALDAGWAIGAVWGG